MYTVLGHAVREGLSKEVTLGRDLDKMTHVDVQEEQGKSRFQAEGMASAKALRQHRV